MNVYSHIIEAHTTKTYKMNLPEVPLQLNTGKSFFDAQTHLLSFYLPQSNHTIECDFHKTLLLGRLNGNAPETLELVDFGGQRLGVSRRHAIIIKHNVTLMLQDLRSSNGTFINGEQLLPHHPMVLRNDDLIQLGKLQLRVIFAERLQ